MIVKEFKQFLLRGNVVDLAVGVVMGAAFGTVVNAIVGDLLSPLVGSLINIPDFSGQYFNFRGAHIMYGHLINSLVSFFLISVTMFFFVVKPMNILIKRSRSEAPADPTTTKCPECISEIPINAKRCSHCAQLVA